MPDLDLHEMRTPTDSESGDWPYNPDVWTLRGRVDRLADEVDRLTAEHNAAMGSALRNLRALRDAERERDEARAELAALDAPVPNRPPGLDDLLAAVAEGMPELTVRELVEETQRHTQRMNRAARRAQQRRDKAEAAGERVRAWAAADPPAYWDFFSYGSAQRDALAALEPPTQTGGAA